MKMLTVAAICLVFIACEKPALITTACQDAIGCVRIGAGEPIQIGVLQPLSGGAALNGQSQINTIRLAISENNSRLMGHPIRLQIEDSACSSEGGNASAIKIAMNTQIVAVIGTFCSASAATASKVISEAGLTMISGSNSAPSLTSVEEKPGKHWHPGYFRVMHNGAGMAEAAAYFAFRQLGITRAATIDDDDLYTSEFTGEFSQVFKKLGGSIVQSVSINKGDKDMAPVMTSIILSGTQCVYFPLYRQEAELFVRQQAKRKKDTAGITFIGGGALLTEAFLRSCGKEATGMYFATVMPPRGKAAEQLSDRYHEKYGERPQHFSYAHTYDAVRIIFSAIKKVADRTKEGTLIIGRQAIRDAMHTISNYPGVTGSLSCDKFGDCSNDQFNVVRLDDPLDGLKGLKSNVVYTFFPETQIGLNH